MKYIDELAQELTKISGVGPKTALRYAYEILEYSDEETNDLTKAIQNLKKIKKCKKCNNYTIDELCSICSDPTRQKNTLIIVGVAKDITKIEKVLPGEYYYYVLGNIIDPLNGKEADDLQIDKIIDKIKEDKVQEILLALPTSSEGEITSEYLKNILNDGNIKFTKIAQGVPIGGDLEYLDELTLLRSIQKRQQF